MASTTTRSKPGPRPAAPTAPDSSTQERLLVAAEQLFADQGFESVSLRHLTQAAGVNLAAVNYHFGSKDALIDAVIERFVTPVNQQRLENLDGLESAHGAGNPVPLRDILTAFFQPFLTRVHRSELSQRLFFKLMGRCMSDPGSRLPESTLPLFRAVAGRFAQALQLAVPHLPQEIIFWRLHFTFGVLAQTLMHNEAMEQITEGRAGKPSPDEILAHIIDYCAAGFAAPHSASDTKV